MKENITRIKRALGAIGNCAFFPKQDFKSTIDFGDTIERIIERGLSSIKRGIWSKLKGSIIIQPNFQGVGIDIKELFKKT